MPYLKKLARKYGPSNVYNGNAAISKKTCQHLVFILNSLRKKFI